MRAYARRALAHWPAQRRHGLTTPRHTARRRQSMRYVSNYGNLCPPESLGLPTVTTSGGSANHRLTVDDWVQTGFRILAEEGVKALTIDRLCRRLGVTKGSFYWHFSDMKAYRRALIDTWATVRDEDRGFFDSVADDPPRQRLSRMMTAMVGPRHWMLERAMREWARSEPAVAAAVRESDERVVAAVRQAFIDDGFDPDEADMRANATFAAGIGFLHLSGSRPNPRAAGRRERFLDVMLRH
ncbi:bacterial regulatory s, tetR family protein [Mycobacterium xenopi 4042]|nr:bacterial regulatory s, tetR family protein [Mycobacterium xenopi 4042]